MSKAFKAHDEGDGLPPVVPPLAPLPAGVPNYVTARGHELLRRAQNDVRERLELARRASPVDATQVQVLTERLRALDARLALAQRVPLPPSEPDEVHFGARVEFRYRDGRVATVRIVGVDEAEPKAGRVAFSAPLARALSGASVGDNCRLTTPKGEEALTVLSIEYSAEPLEVAEE
jgi:transcription elongation factor GreB